MGWITEVCEDVVCGGGLSLVRGIFSISLFTEKEAQEIHNLKTLALDIIQKSPAFKTDDAVCEGLRLGQQAALDSFGKNAPAEAVNAGVVVAANLVCSQAFEARFRKILMGACLNLAGC